jgi:putative peptidoglycan lipid II flippase
VISAFPALCAREGPMFNRTCAGSTRAVVLVSWLGAALTLAIAVPAAHVLAKQADQVPELIEGFALLAPGLVASGVIMNLSRAMFAIGRLGVAAAALAGNSLLTMVVDVGLVELAPPHLVVAALALGNTIGQTLVAIPFVIVTRRIRGKTAVHGVGHTVFAGSAAAAVGATVGMAVSVAIPVSHKLMAACVAILAASCAVIAFGAVAYVLDRGDLHAALAQLRRIAWLRRIVGQDAA